MLRLAWMEPLPSVVALITWSDPSLPLLIVADTDRLPRLPPPFFDDDDDDVASSDFFRDDEPLGFLPDADDADDDAVVVVGMEGKAGMDWWAAELRAGDESASGCTGRECLEPRPPPGELVGAPSAGAESETERRTLVAAAAEVSMQCCSGEGLDGDGDGDELGEQKEGEDWPDSDHPPPSLSLSSTRSSMPPLTAARP
jgi:hypothetical protein